MTDEAHELLRAILGELRGVRADLRSPRQPHAEIATHVDLLRAIEATTAGLTFSVAELLEHAEVVAQRAADPRLHAAIEGAVGAVNGRRLGKLLGRLEGEALGGLMIERVATGRDGVLWRIASLRV